MKTTWRLHRLRYDRLGKSRFLLAVTDSIWNLGSFITRNNEGNNVASESDDVGEKYGVAGWPGC